MKTAFLKFIMFLYWLKMEAVELFVYLASGERWR